MSTREASDKQESRVAKGLKEFGGRKVAGSGASDYQKGDVKTPDLFIECKTKMEESKSIKVEKAWFTKAKEQAFAMGKHIFTVVFSFGDGQDWFVVSSDFFKDLYAGYKAKEKLDILISELNSDVEHIKVEVIERILRGEE